MKKKGILKLFYIAAIIAIMVCFIGLLTVKAESDLQEVVVTEPTINLELYAQQHFDESLDYIELDTSNDCLDVIGKCNEYSAFLQNTLTENLNPEIEAITLSEIDRVNEIKLKYQSDYNRLLEEEAIAAYWNAKREEYPVATEVWLYMKNEFGWNDIVCAGIMGNIMAEIGGGTLNFDNWNANGSSGYGMIQWISSRRRQLKSIYGEYPTPEQQLEFMYDEMHGTDGVTNQLYISGSLDRIMNATTPGDAAYYFAIYFERCADWAVTVRPGYARIAYDYFTN